MEIVRQVVPRPQLPSLDSRSGGGCSIHSSFHLDRCKLIDLPPSINDVRHFTSSSSGKGGRNFPSSLVAASPLPSDAIRLGQCSPAMHR